jgi:hypothetical protein
MRKMHNTLAALLCGIGLLATVAPGCSCTRIEQPTAQSFEADDEQETTDDTQPITQADSPDGQPEGDVEPSEGDLVSESGDVSADATAQPADADTSEADANSSGESDDLAATLKDSKQTTNLGASTGDSSNNPAGTLSGRTARLKHTAAEAQRNAKNAMAAADATAKAGSPGRAFEIALKGWEQAQAHAESDVACRALAKQLLSQLERYGEEANRNTSEIPDDTKTLITR